LGLLCLSSKGKKKTFSLSSEMPRLKAFSLVMCMLATRTADSFIFAPAPVRLVPTVLGEARGDINVPSKRNAEPPVTRSHQSSVQLRMSAGLGGGSVAKILRAGGDAAAAVTASTAARDSKPEELQTMDAGEWLVLAASAESKMEGTRVIIDDGRGLAQFDQPFASTLESRTLNLQRLRIMRLHAGSALLLARKESGEVVALLVEIADASVRLKFQDLPGYFQGFLNEERENASSLDNLTPNLKLGASVTALVIAAVGLLIFMNPPPPKDQPLPTARAASASGAAQTRSLRAAAVDTPDAASE